MDKPDIRLGDLMDELIAALKPLLDNADGYDVSVVRGLARQSNDARRQEWLDMEERARLAWKAVSALGRASGAPQEITYEETHVMESGPTRGVDDGGLDRSASDVAGVQAATDASPHEGPRGTYNCPVCGWNVPHREHAGEVIEQLSFELNAWKAWWQHVVLMLRSGIRPGCSLSVAKLACDELIAGRGALCPAPFIAPMFDKRPLVPALSSPSVADSPATTALELLRHIQRGHSAVNREHYIECSCGMTFWVPTPKPLSAPSPSTAAQQETP